jgi:hypothetical protein
MVPVEQVAALAPDAAWVPAGPTTGPGALGRPPPTA